VTLEAVLSLIRRRWLPIVLCVIAGLAGGFAHAQTTPKSYQSTARLFINIPAAANTQEALQGVELSTQLIKSYAAIVTSHAAASAVKERLGLPDSVGAIKHELSAHAEPDTLIIDIVAQDADPARAQSIAQAAAVVLNDAIRSLEQTRAPSSAVQASIVDPAVTPGKPSSPQPTRDILFGLVLGFLGAAAMALVLDALDRSVKTAPEVERLVGAPSLAVVPRNRNKSKPLAADGATMGPAAEAYRALRTALRFLDPDDPIRSLVITSPNADEGKSTTAANLALALAQSGERVILVDADLRQAGLCELLGIESAVGLTGVLTGQVPLHTALQPYRDRLTVLPAGVLPPNPSELLGSQRMAALIDELGELSDIVVFDTSPVLPVTDAVVLAAQVDGAALVLRHGRTSRNHAVEAVRRLRAVDAGVVGAILNGRPRPEATPYYSAYDTREASRPPVEA